MPIRKRPDIQKYIKRIDNNNLALFANELISDIVIRTQSGKDYINHSFKPYSEKYKKIKSAQYGSSTVNLTQSGKMLNSITWKQIKGGIRLYFNAKSQNDKAHGNQVKNGRKFFALSNNQIKGLKKKLSKILMK